MSTYRHFFIILFYSLLIAIDFLAFTSIEINPIQNIWDKANHFVAFLTLYVVLTLSYPKMRLLNKIALLLAYGLQIEIVQYFLPHREFSLLDVEADAIGIFAGMMVEWIWYIRYDIQEFWELFLNSFIRKQESVEESSVDDFCCGTPAMTSFAEKAKLQDKLYKKYLPLYQFSEPIPEIFSTNNFLVMDNYIQENLALLNVTLDFSQQLRYILYSSNEDYEAKFTKLLDVLNDGLESKTDEQKTRIFTAISNYVNARQESDETREQILSKVKADLPKRIEPIFGNKVDVAEKKIEVAISEEEEQWLQVIVDWADEFNIIDTSDAMNNLDPTNIYCSTELNIPIGLPRDKKLLLNLTAINLHLQGITYIPDEFFNLTRLRYLYLDFNELEIPSSISNLKYLQTLVLDTTRIETLPDTFSNLTNLINLSLDGNNFKEFPLQLTKLSGLKALSMSSNSIETLPNEIGNMIELDYLNLDYNKLLILPDTFGNLVNLDTCTLRGNKLAENVKTN